MDSLNYLLENSALERNKQMYSICFRTTAPLSEGSTCKHKAKKSPCALFLNCSDIEFLTASLTRKKSRTRGDFFSDGAHCTSSYSRTLGFTFILNRQPGTVLFNFALVKIF
jgi:hypothetical protein